MPRRRYALQAVTWTIALACSVTASAQTTTVGFAGAATIAVGAPPPLVSAPLVAAPGATARGITENPRVLKSLRFAFVGVQALDVHSTWKALSGGATEGNAAMRPLTSSPALYTAIKAGMTFLVYRGTERGEKRHGKAMFWLLVASDAAMTMVAIHNYRTAAAR